jgi:hypothetical protein
MSLHGRDETVPSIASIEANWRAIIDGGCTREEVHDWAAQWVEDDDFDPLNPMILQGLQYLHGFDLRASLDNPGVVGRHGDRPYMQSDQDILESLWRWKQKVQAQT